MIRINLLPHREEKRKARRQQFIAMAGMIALLAGAIVALIHGINANDISNQQAKNEFLRREIAVLDKQIDEIKRLREQSDALLSRKQVIESLQANRAETVQLFNELARQVPEGVYLQTVKQTGSRINIVGYAQSNARVSNLMRNLDGSPLLQDPALIETRAATVGNRRVYSFNLNVGITQPKPEDKGAPAAKPAAGGKPA